MMQTIKTSGLVIADQVLEHLNLDFVMVAFRNRSKHDILEYGTPEPTMGLAKHLQATGGPAPLLLTPRRGGRRKRRS